MLLKLRNTRGDTIVEVLIAIAIVSLTLTGAFVSVNRSTNATRTAQERGEALKWAETQVEQIKATPGPITATNFCYTTNLAIQVGINAACTSGPIPYSAKITQSPANSGNFKVVVTWGSLEKGTPINRVELDYIK